MAKRTGVVEEDLQAEVEVGAPDLATVVAERDRLAAALEALEKRLAVMEVTPIGPRENVEEAWVRYRRGFQYNGMQLDWGQVIRLRGARNDEKLLRLGHFQPVDARAERCQCGVCGAEFIGLEMREAHGDLRHNFECACGQAFYWVEELDRHQRQCDQWRAMRRQLSPV